MHRLKFTIGSVAVFSILFIVSCATASNTLSSEYRDSINKIIIVEEHEGDNLQILDHTNVINTQTTSGQYGAIPVLMEELFEGAAANSRIKKSIGGNPDLLRDAAGNIEIDDMVYEHLRNRIIKRYQIVDGRKLHKKNIMIFQNHSRIVLSMNQLWKITI